MQKLPSGAYSLLSGAKICTRCPLGHFCSDPTQLPKPCPPGTYGDLYGQTKCSTCPEGYYTIQSQVTYCKKCPLGHSCTDPAQSPQPCPLGFHNALYAQTTCRQCKAGWTTTFPGQVECTNLSPQTG